MSIVLMGSGLGRVDIAPGYFYNNGVLYEGTNSLDSNWVGAMTLDEAKKKVAAIKGAISSTKPVTVSNGTIQKIGMRGLLFYRKSDGGILFKNSVVAVAPNLLEAVKLASAVEKKIPVTPKGMTTMDYIEKYGGTVISAVQSYAKKPETNVEPPDHTNTYIMYGLGAALLIAAILAIAKKKKRGK